MRPQWDIEEAVAVMVQHRIRRLPVTDEEELVGIVTIDDLAVRAGDLHQAQQITAEVAQGRAARVLLPPAGRVVAQLTPGSSAPARAWRA